MFPNFRKIYTQFRTREEERVMANHAVFKLCGFGAISLVLLLGRQTALK